ncbi:MAG: hypothetical protein ACR2G4_17320 [Pyrinomonadaceae bacterium]
MLPPYCRHGTIAGTFFEEKIEFRCRPDRVEPFGGVEKGSTATDVPNAPLPAGPAISSCAASAPGANWGAKQIKKAKLNTHRGRAREREVKFIL